MIEGCERERKGVKEETYSDIHTPYDYTTTTYCGFECVNYGARGGRGKEGMGKTRDGDKSYFKWLYGTTA